MTFIDLTEQLVPFSLTIFSGILLFFCLILIKQNWINTFHYFLTLLILPMTTFVITKVISNNLALSLGMIGALSIVRFRNPVKNPLELVLYFSLITLGISFSVNMNWGLLFLFTLIFVLIISKFIEMFSKKKKLLNLFNYSFSYNDGLNKIFIEIDSKKNIDFLENHECLEFFSKSGENFIYKLSLENKTKLEQLKKLISNSKDISDIQIRYNG